MKPNPRPLFSRLPAVLLLALFGAWGAAAAAERPVSPGPGALARAVKMAEAGDILRLAPGIYYGPLTIARPLVLDPPMIPAPAATTKTDPSN